MPLYSSSSTDLLLKTSLDTNIGIPTDTAAANASVTNKGLIGLLKGLWQTLLDRLPALSSGAIPVVATEAIAATITKTTVALTTTSSTVLAANPNRIGWVVTNSISNTATAYLDYGASAILADGMILPPSYERMPDYSAQGQISGIATGPCTIIVREFSK